MIKKKAWKNGNSKMKGKKKEYKNVEKMTTRKKKIKWMKTGILIYEQKKT